MNNKIMKLILLFVCINLISVGCAEVYKSPPNDMDVASVVGSWTTKYTSYQVDTIVINDDETFTQQFEDSRISYLFETTGEWYLQHFPDGSIYLHLLSGRYYVEGIKRAEQDGRDLPCTQEFSDCWWENDPFLFYDPYRDSFVEMLDQLILTIRADRLGDIVLHHLWTSSDRGFTLIGGEDEIFRRIEGP